jgi:hypothetical protein
MPDLAQTIYLRGHWILPCYGVNGLNARETQLRCQSKFRQSHEIFDTYLTASAKAA